MWLIGVAMLGFVVDRWYAVIGCLATVASLWSDPLGVDTELVGLLVAVYLPGSLVAILLGLGARALFRVKTGRRGQRRVQS